MNIQDKMTSLCQRKLISPQDFIIDNLEYATLSGSISYGVSTDVSDMDIYGFTIPPLENIFPILKGEIPGFGNQIQNFKSYTQSGIIDGDTVYDFNIYNIVNYFQLAMDNNPNVLDTLFTDDEYVVHNSPISDYIRENKTSFLHKGLYYKYKGFAHSQLKKLLNGSNSQNPKRIATIEKYGFDTKFAYHIVRLMLQAEQVLIEHDMDITANSELLKSIRTGEWTLDQIISWKETKEKDLDNLYESSTLRHSPDEKIIKKILLNALEMKYGILNFFPREKEVSINNIIPSN